MSADVAEPPPVTVTFVKSELGTAATVKPAKTTFGVPCKIGPEGCEISASVVDGTGVTDAQVVPTLISSITKFGVVPIASCLKRTL